MAEASVFGNEQQAEATRQGFENLFASTTPIDATHNALSLLANIPGFPALTDGSIRPSLAQSITPLSDNERIARTIPNPGILDTTEVRFVREETALIMDGMKGPGYQEVSSIHISRKKLDQEVQVSLAYDRQTGALKQILLQVFPWGNGPDSTMEVADQLKAANMPLGKRETIQPLMMVAIDTHNELQLAGPVKSGVRRVEDRQILELMQSLSQRHNRPVDKALSILRVTAK